MRRTKLSEALQLLRDVKVGPGFLQDVGQKEAYDLWANTWVIPKIKRLIPQLEKHFETSELT